MTWQQQQQELRKQMNPDRRCAGVQHHENTRLFFKVLFFNTLLLPLTYVLHDPDHMTYLRGCVRGECWCSLNPAEAIV